MSTFQLNVTTHEASRQYTVDKDRSAEIFSGVSSKRNLQQMRGNTSTQPPRLTPTSPSIGQPRRSSQAIIRLHYKSSIDGFSSSTLARTSFFSKTAKAP